MERHAIECALREVGDAFGAQSRDTILCENLEKHTFEISAIWNAAGAAGTVCDLGGGLGVNLIALRALGHAGRLILIDRFDEYDEHNRMGAWSDARAVLERSGVECLRQDFWGDPALPLPDECARVVTCFDVVEHLPGHPLRQLRELWRLLNRGGTCIISGPNSVSLMKRLKLAAGRYPYSSMALWLEDRFYEHYREYTPPEYGELLVRAGFQDVSVIPSAVVTVSRARTGYHRRRLSPLSPRRLALWALAAVETAVPSFRHMVYATGIRGA